MMIHKGYKFNLEIATDLDAGPPWEDCDGHGIVTDWQSTDCDDPPAGYRVLCEDRGIARYYDMNASLKKAIREQWGCVEKGHTTKAQIAAQAVEEDYEYLRGYCQGDWDYIVVCVTLLDCGGKDTGECASLGGVDTSQPSYTDEVAHELADEILARVHLRGAQRNAMDCPHCHGTGSIPLK